MAADLLSFEECSIDGIRLGTSSAGIRQTERDDLTIIEIAEKSQVAAVFTKNAFCAAPVTIAKQHLIAKTPKYLLINSGNANAGTGQNGYDDGLETCQILADQTSEDQQEILPFSTGVIGERLPTELFPKAIAAALINLQASGWANASHAIMTTDTQTKQATAECQIQGKKISLVGIAKGSGMIRPDMATMLAYVGTDAKLDSNTLNECLSRAVEKSFNRITVDGDTSTNDACVLIATGRTDVLITSENSTELEQFQKALDQVCTELAQAIVKDGEGASKFISIVVSGGANKQECLQVGYTIAHSPLVKTAFFASDPNWGRLLAAIGRADLSELDIAKVSVKLDDVSLIEKGEPASSYTEELGAAVMQKNEITVYVDLARGSYSDTVWTCDLSYDYVKINAEYRT